MNRSATSVRVVFAITALAVVFGVLHDLLSAAVCTEYFTEAHPKIVESKSWLAMAFVWGFLATFWVGAIGGVWLAVCTQVGSAPPVGLPRILRATAIGAGVVLGLAPVTWYSLYAFDGGVYVPDLERRLGASLAMHNQSYFLAAVVFLGIGIAFVFKRYASR
jgi:hypothetical protein